MKNAFILLFVVLAVAASPLLSLDKMLYAPYSDLVLFYAPKALFFSQSLSNGVVPFWDPMLNSGYPFIGHPEISFPFYPPNLLFVPFPTPAMFNGLFLLHLYAAGCFMFLFLRKRLGWHASLFGAIAYMLSGQSLAQAHAGHYLHVVSIAFLPLLFLLADMAFDEKKLRAPILLGMALALDYFGGHIHLFFFSLLALAAYVALRIAGGAPWGAAKRFALAAMLAVLLSLPQLVAQWEFSRFVDRFSYERAAELSLTPFELFRALVPDLFGGPAHYLFLNSFWETLLYLGAPSLILLILAFRERKRLPKDARIFLVLLLAFFVIALGRYTPFFGVLWKFVPLFDLFKGPGRGVFVMTFAAAVLASYGFESFIRNRRLHRFVSNAALLCAMVVAAAAFAAIMFRNEIVQALHYFYSVVFRDAPFVQRTPFDLLVQERFNPGIAEFAWQALLVAAFLLALAASCRFLKKKWLPAIVIALLALELAVFAHSMLQMKKIADVYPDDPVLAFLGTDTSFFRVMEADKLSYSFAPGYNLSDYASYRNGIQKTTGVNTVYLNFYSAYYNGAGDAFLRGNKTMVDALNVKYILSPFPLNQSGLRIVAVINGTTVYLNEGAAPRVSLSNGSAAIESYGPDEIVVRTRGNGRLVLRELAYPGWTAQCGETEMPLRAEGIFRAVDVDNCPCVRFSYAPPNFFPAVLVSLAALVASVAALAFGSMRKEPS